MKNFFGTAAAALICLGMLSGCGNNEAAETFSETSVTSAETEITAVTEISETANTETEETVAISETETSAETEQKKPSYEIIDMSGYTGNFYEWEYDYDIVAYDRENFAGGEDIINAAEKLLADENGLLFESGVWEDFDGDGKKEGFLLFSRESDLWVKIYHTVFADADGGVHILKDSTGPNGTLNPMRYNGFLHMCAEFGASISSSHMEIYSVEKNSAEEKYIDFFKGEPLDGAFILVSHPQGGGSSIMFWNEQRREYCQIGGERVPEEDINDILESEAFAGSSYDEMSTEELDKATIVRTAFFNYGGKYFCTASGYGFERRDGEIVLIDKDITIINYGKCTMARGLNIEKAQAKMIRLEK